MKPTRNTIVNVLFVLLTGIALAACGTGNTGTTASPERYTSDAFSIVQFEGLGTYGSELDVQESGDTVVVTVRATDAVEVESVALHLEFNPSRLRVNDVEVGDFLGTADETLSLYLTDRAGYVPIGITQIASMAPAPAIGSGVIATVEFARESSDIIRSVSYSSPGNPQKNAVDDLAIVNTEGGVAHLHWTELNVGDYNNDGLVSVNDMTPVGQFYGQQVSTAGDPDRVWLADGTRDDWIQVDDITPIGQNYDVQLSGYILYTDIEGTTPFGTGITMTREAAVAESDNANHPIEYNFDATLPTGEVHFTVRPVCATDLDNPGPVSNDAEWIDDGVDPEPPTNVTAVSNSETGHKRVLVTWDASTSLDVQHYVVERQLDSNPGVWVELNTVGSTSLTDDDTTKAEEDYTYRVKTVDLTDRESDFVESNSVTPYVVFLAPPTNLTVNNAIPTASAIQLNWTAPADLTGVIGYRVYDADTNDALFTASATTVTEWTHTELTQGVTYNYYVVSVGLNSVESEPSNTEGTTPSVYVEEINIQSFTTNKTTHYYGLSEDPANLVVTTDYTADSVTWDGGGGTISGTGTSVTWQPTMLMPAQKVTVSVTVHRGSAQDTAELDLYVVTYPIKTNMGQDGGHYIDFSGSCFTAIIDGGGISNRSFSEFCSTENAILMDFWEQT